MRKETQELRPVHLTPRWNSLKTDTINYTHRAVLEPFKNFNNQGWKTLFQHTLHSKKPYLEWLTLKPITRMNKEKITPETVLQEHKPVVLFTPRQYHHLHPTQGSSRTSPHIFSFWKTFAKTVPINFLTQNVVSLSKLWLFSIPSREKDILFYREQFLTTFQKTVTEEFTKHHIDSKNNRLKDDKAASSA